ncbi:MAG: ferritin-like domain-containing protein [Helicobacter sp.]|nr:ferritin-like domain-containing protein [Helicobacter sp.]
MCHSLNLDNIPLGKLFFLRLENAFLLADTGDTIEILSRFDHLESELISWCRLKGESFVQKTALKGCFAYLLRKDSAQNFVAFSPELALAPREIGLAPHGVVAQRASPDYHFALNHKDELWSKNIDRMYEDAKAAQWNATSAIAWGEIPDFVPKVEFAIAQIMTYLIENELSALYIPAKFLAQVSPYFMPIPMLLSSIIGDEARHIEAFTKRANATRLGVQYSTLTTQQSLFSLFKENNYLAASFLLHIMGEGTFIDLLKFLEDCAPDLPTKKLFNLARRDEARHVAYGMNNVKMALSSNPHRVGILKDSVLRRKVYLDEVSGESTLLLESLAVFAGGGDGAAEIARGFEMVENLKAKMELNRTKRLVECGIDEELAHELSKAHTPNFM